MWVKMTRRAEPGALEFGHTSRHSIYGWQTVMSEGGAAIRCSRFVQDVGYLCPDNALRPTIYVHFSMRQ